MKVLLTLLQSITANTCNPDVVYLSIISARETCRQLGIPAEEVEETLVLYQKYSEFVRAGNPLSGMF